LRFAPVLFSGAIRIAPISLGLRTTNYMRPEIDSVRCRGNFSTHPILQLHL
jgi:hypothetical protein